MKTNKARFFQVLRKAARPSGQPSNQTSKKRRSGSSSGKQTRPRKPEDISRHFHRVFAGKLWTLIAHQLANLMGHAPRGLVGDAKLPFQFLGRYTVPAGGHQEDGEEPRDKRRGGLVKYGASGRVKLVAAPRAGIRAPFLNRVKAILLPAFRALAAVWPAGVEHKIKARPLVRELGLEVV